jgi:ribonuclease HI
MTEIAHEYYRELHTVRDIQPLCRDAQLRLLQEVKDTYRGIPGPVNPVTGLFSLAEVRSLRHRMPNSAPGPDGIPYPFWKALSSRIDTLIKASGDRVPPSFWITFMNLANWIRRHGTNSCGFKNANLSLFFKKGDPTLVSNYRPISSMNTDCKMFTNLVNSHLSPWAVCKLHQDQKGFVPGRHITEHTRLATEVVHLVNRFDVNRYLVSLDQSKAYDRVDQHLLMETMSCMGLLKDLTDMISDIIHKPQTRVRINSGYSRWFSLGRGVHQGDPLSCLLYDFSIEPLGMKLRATLQGVSVMGLPPAKLLMYTDDTNLFVNETESLPDIKQTLDCTADALGSAFNNEKTVIKPFGDTEFMATTHLSGTDNTKAFRGAEVLPPGSPIRILSVWIDSPDRVVAWWHIISKHISKIIAQWCRIGASTRNRVLLAKALLQSRCYYLLDGNGIPQKILKQISQKIQCFVWGPNSCMPYSFLASPVAKGRLDCPPLAIRKEAWDLKFLGDLLSRDQTALWKVWTLKDLELASRPSVSSWKAFTNPFLQRSYVTFLKLETRVRDATTTARKYGLYPLSSNPPHTACQSMPLFHHPAIIMGRLNKLECLQVSHGVQLLGDLSDPPSSTVPDCRDCTRNIGILVTRIRDAGWMPQNWAPAQPDRANIWPECQSPYDLMQFMTNPYNVFIRTGLRMRDMVASPTFPGHSFRPPLLLTQGSKMATCPAAVKRYCVNPPNPRGQVIEIWTNGSAADNGTESCTAGSGWITSRGLQQWWRLVGLPVSNNIAEAVAMVTAISRHTDSPIMIHTDSSFVLGLVGGGLLELERTGWPPVPCLQSTDPLISYRPLYQNLLSALRYHGRVRFSKVTAHSGDTNNKTADYLANKGRLLDRTLDISLLQPLPSWVDTAPSLTSQSLKDITGHLVDHTFPPPASRDKFAHFTSIWENFQNRNGSPVIPAATCLYNVWKLPIPPSLAEILWK